MADTAAPVKAPKKKAPAKPKVPPAHPTYAVMVAEAIKALKERSGSSRQALLKYIKAHYKVGTDDKMINARLKVALRNGVKSGVFKHAKGAGASGSFKLGEKKAAPKPKKVKKPKAKTPAKKKTASPKKAAAKKAKATPKKPKAKKPKATTAKKSPKKAAAKPKKVKTPKKAPAKKPTKKAAAKK